jgi:hypothetical protein
MSVRTQRKRFLALAEQLNSGKPLTKKQITYLTIKFEELGEDGADANKVLGLSYMRGRSKQDEIRRENLRFIFSWVMGVMDKGLGHGYNTTKALQEAVKFSNKRGYPFKPLTYNSLRRAWYDERYQHFKINLLSALQEDSPLKFKK